MKKIIAIFLLFPSLAFAADTTDTTDSAQAARVAELERTRDTLKSDLTQIDSEMAWCEKQNKNWKIATIVGGVGVAATGTLATIQGKKISDNKGELAAHILPPVIFLHSLGGTAGVRKSVVPRVQSWYSL